MRTSDVAAWLDLNGVTDPEERADFFDFITRLDRKARNPAGWKG